MRYNQRGFVLTLAILMLVVMSIMGVTLIVLVSNDVRQNDSKDEYQQALYTAETAVSLGKTQLQTLVSSGRQLPQAETILWTQATAPNWCRPSRFSKVINTNAIYKVYALPAVMFLGTELYRNAPVTNMDDLNRYNQYQMYYFITNAPTADATLGALNTLNSLSTLNTKNAKIGSSAQAASGTTVAEKTAYKSIPTSGSQMYTIFACGKSESDIVVALDVTVTLSMQ